MRTGAASYICWNCQSRLAILSPKRVRIVRNGTSITTGPSSLRRTFHATHLNLRPAATVSSSQSLPEITNPAILDLSQPIRQRLKLWEKEYGGPSKETLKAFENFHLHGQTINGMAKLSVGAKSDDDRVSQDEEHEDDEEVSSIMTLNRFIRPGDVVELSVPGREPVLAVFVQQLESICQFFSVNGRWSHTTLRNVSFVIPGCIDPGLVLPLVPYLPTKPDEASILSEVHVPPSIRAPVKKLLEDMTHDSEKIYRENSTTLDNAFSTLADDDRVRIMTLSQIAKTLLAPQNAAFTPTPAALLAVRKALKHNEYRFRSDLRSSRITNVFTIRPKGDVEVVELVHEWIRQYQEHRALQMNRIIKEKSKLKGVSNITKFIEKARRLVQLSRQARDPLLGQVGSSKPPSGASKRSLEASHLHAENFTQADKRIINFLQAWALTRQFDSMHDLQSACSAVLQATECYEQEAYTVDKISEHGAFDSRCGYLFLQELGVVSPYDNIAVYDEQLMLPTLRLSRNLDLLNVKAESTRRNPDFRDSMADMRHDWGKLEAYCIDSADAQEIDDGISVQRVEGKASDLWLHIHVANPTAFFNKTHVLSGLAAHMTETVYLVERTFPMLPAWATQNYFSLGNNRPVLTFSARLDLSTGTIIETKARAGIIRRTTNITPTELSSCLGESPVSRFKTSLVVGGPVPASTTKTPPPKPSNSQLQDLEDLYAAARVLWEKRRMAGGIRMHPPRLECRVYEEPNKAGLSYFPPSTDTSRSISGDPIIELKSSVSPYYQIQLDMDATSIVEEMMVLAGQTMAAWCAERNIPVIYRGTHRDSSLDISGLDPASVPDLQEMIREGRQEEIDEMPMALRSQLLRNTGRSIVHYSPIPHAMLGIPAYVKCTSPLRRFSDMIVHWQIEAALRHENRTGKKLDVAAETTSSRQILPFSKRQIQESIITLAPRESLIRQSQRRSNQFWSNMAFMRAFYYRETLLPETLTIIVERPAKSNRGLAAAFIEGFNLIVIVEPVSGLVYQPGDRWEVKINHISVYDGRIKVDPVKLLHRDERFLDLN